MYDVSLTRPEPGPVITAGFMHDPGGFDTLSQGYGDGIVDVASLGTVLPPSSGERFSLSGLWTDPTLWQLVAAGVAAGLVGLMRRRREDSGVASNKRIERTPRALS